MPLVALVLLVALSDTAPPELEYGLDGFAFSIAVAPDQDGDGIEDLLVGDPDPRREVGARGSFWILSGASGRRIARIEGPVDRPWFGVSVAWLGAREKGGEPAFAIGDVASHPGDSLRYAENRGDVGRVHVVARDGRELALRVSDPWRRAFGRWIVSAGDLDGDGVGDLVLPVGSRTVDGMIGSIRVLSGRTLEETSSITATPMGVGITLPVADVGPLLVCSSVHDGIFVRRTVQVHRLGARPALLHKIEGRPDEPNFGHCVADVGDLDADGWPEIAVGITVLAPRRESESARSAVRIFSSKTGGVVRELAGPEERPTFGTAIAVRAARTGEDAPVLLVTTSQAFGGRRGAAELHEISTRTWSTLRVRDLDGRGGERMVVLRGTDGSQRVATSRSDCDDGGFAGAVTILSDDAPPIVVTRASLVRGS